MATDLDLDTDELLTVEQAAALFPGGAGRASVDDSTVRRWMRKGTKGVRLQAAVVGNRTYTTRRWVEEFIAACTEAAMGEHAKPVTSAASARQRARESAEVDRLLA